MSDDSPYQSNGIQPMCVQTPDTINSLVITGDFGFNWLEGPFEVEKDGTKWTVVVPIDELGATPTSALENSVGDGCVLLAGCEPVGGGLIDLVDEPGGLDELHVVVDQYARGEP